MSLNDISLSLNDIACQDSGGRSRALGPSFFVVISKLALPGVMIVFDRASKKIIQAFSDVLVAFPYFDICVQIPVQIKKSRYLKRLREKSD